MSGLTCRELIEFLDSYVAEELLPERRSEFERHLAICSACREYLAEYQRSIELVRALRDAPGNERAEAVVPEGLVKAVLSAMKRA